jgi:hypothetical protein
MTKRMLVFLPCLVIALAFAGCGTDGDGGSAKKASNPFASMDNDVMAEGLAAGYISTVVSADAVPMNNVLTAKDGISAQSRQVFLSHPSQMQAMEGQIGASTLVPKRDTRLDMRYSPQDVSAKAEPDGMIALTAGDQVSYIRKVDVGGRTFTSVVGADGSVSLGGENAFPKLVESGQGVVLVNGSLVPVE